MWTQKETLLVDALFPTQNSVLFLFTYVSPHLLKKTNPKQTNKETKLSEHISYIDIVLDCHLETAEQVGDALYQKLKLM